MKTRFIIILLCIAGCLSAQTGKVFDNLSMKSEILKMDRKFAIYLPPDYETSERSYPVLYLLHGAGDDQTGWVQFGEVLRITDQAIKDGTATPMIIVMPDAKTGQMGYFNVPQTDWRYEDFFFEELMPYVENNYRIKKEKRYRAISGLSMGGGGTFMYAMHRPDLFSSAAPLSAYVGPLSIEQFKEQVKRMNLKTSDEEIEAYFKRHNAISLIEDGDPKQISSVRWFIDCGDDDFLYEGNSLVHIAMKKKEIPHEYRVRDGGHTWTYWRESLPVVLKFVSDAFHQY
ncbi:alpha/beta hydrolase-fold protein [Roseivirga sp. UBA1976]|uniref:alpha/beta hydrolase n=1 Tax=Roseivirga sp. UBA1976 TaxID=1947386 RepID=UPI0025800EFB|nr:alpha/beta hydrolase-fold protein [Roseivirga sp. UBA1976]|tara:strand:+ start:894 stop:1751 length:858 start_codon:yes stop_codon:yes gene_type:complete